MVATEFAKEVSALFPKKIEAVFAIGSLGSDYYRPGQSDIDTVVFAKEQLYQGGVTGTGDPPSEVSEQACIKESLI